MRRHVLALLGGLFLLPPPATHAALTIDSFESGPFSMSVTTDGFDESVQNPNPAQCIAAQRYTHLNWAWDEEGANILYHRHFYGRKAIPLITQSMAKRLSPVTGKAYQAETLHTNLKESFGNREK